MNSSRSGISASALLTRNQAYESSGSHSDLRERTSVIGKGIMNYESMPQLKRIASNKGDGLARYREDRTEAVFNLPEDTDIDQKSFGKIVGDQSKV